MAGKHGLAGCIVDLSFDRFVAPYDGDFRRREAQVDDLRLPGVFCGPVAGAIEETSQELLQIGARVDANAEGVLPDRVCGVERGDLSGVKGGPRGRLLRDDGTDSVFIAGMGWLDGTDGKRAENKKRWQC